MFPRVVESGFLSDLCITGHVRFISRRSGMWFRGRLQFEILKRAVVVSSGTLRCGKVVYHLLSFQLSNTILNNIFHYENSTGWLGKHLMPIGAEKWNAQPWLGSSFSQDQADMPDQMILKLTITPTTYEYIFPVYSLRYIDMLVGCVKRPI